MELEDRSDLARGRLEATGASGGTAALLEIGRAVRLCVVLAEKALMPKVIGDPRESVAPLRHDCAAVFRSPDG